MADFFISFARVDSEAVKTISAKLGELGYSIWRDSLVSPGMDYRAAVEAELQAAKAVIVIWTPHSIESEFVLAEARIAAQQSKLISVRSDDLDVREIPFEFRMGHVLTVSEFIARQTLKPDQADMDDAVAAIGMSVNNLPKTVDSATQTQAERDAIYAERMEKDDVPPTLSSAPIAPSAAPEAPRPGPALTTQILPAAAASDNFVRYGSGRDFRPALRREGVGSARSDVAAGHNFLRVPSAAKTPVRMTPVGNVALTHQKIEEFALLRQQNLEGENVRAPPSSKLADAPHASPPTLAKRDDLEESALDARARWNQESHRELERSRAGIARDEQMRSDWKAQREIERFQQALRQESESHLPRSSAKTSSGGGFLVLVVIAALASLPLFNQTVRDGLTAVLAGLGLKLNAFNFFGMFAKRAVLSAPIEQQVKVDEVDCSVYSPPSAPRGATVLIQVFLHIPEQAARVHGLATMMDTTSALKGVQTLSASIARGTTVDVYLSAADLNIPEPAQSFIWRGEPVFRQFLVTLPEAGTSKSFHPIIRLSIGGGLVGRIVFRIEAIEGQQAVEALLNATQSVPAGHVSQRYRQAFLSYATPDRREVLKRAQALEAAGVKFFQDTLSLEPGSRWEKELYRHIDECDLFLLFWSKHAAESQWVIKEAEYAKARQKNDAKLDFIPIILDGPPPHLPPESLIDIHFNDRISYFIAAS